MQENGKEELRLATESGSLLDGVPYCTVIVDGGWSKRSYGHGYNALSGLVRIINIHDLLYSCELCMLFLKRTSFIRFICFRLAS